MRRIATLSLALAVAAVGCNETDPATPVADLPTAESLRGPPETAGFGPAGKAVYRVTFTNLTADAVAERPMPPVAGGQPLTPPILAVHRRPASLFTVGEPASFEVKEIAENGNLGPMMDLLGANKHVIDQGVALPSMTPPPPPLFPGESRSIEVVSERGAKYLSFVSMLICTNDGFTGVDGLRLPGELDESVTVYGDGYDAGTEVNTEDYADLVPPCQGLVAGGSSDDGTGTSDPALAEGGVIHHHPGIDGTGSEGTSDLDPAVHDWANPVVEVTVERIG